MIIHVIAAPAYAQQVAEMVAAGRLPNSYPTREAAEAQHASYNSVQQHTYRVHSIEVRQ